MGEALRHEYENIAATGVLLQLDAPDLAMGRHTRYASLSDTDFVKQVVQPNVDVMNKALRNIAQEQVRVHVCWGNYAGCVNPRIMTDYGRDAY